jgi:hypothetical protein
MSSRPEIKNLRLFRISPTLSSAKITFPSVTLSNVRCYWFPGNRVVLELPTIKDRKGVRHPAYEMSKALLGDVGREVERLWKEADANGSKTVSKVPRPADAGEATR